MSEAKPEFLMTKDKSDAQSMASSSSILSSSKKAVGNLGGLQESINGNEGDKQSLGQSHFFGTPLKDSSKTVKLTMGSESPINN